MKYQFTNNYKNWRNIGINDYIADPIDYRLTAIEHVTNYCDLFFNYGFKQIVAHYSPLDDTIQLFKKLYNCRSTVFIYTLKITSPNIEQLELPNYIVNYVFFDFLFTVDIVDVKLPKDDWISFYWNNRWICTYDKLYHSLYCSDWTHFGDYREIVKHILELLAQKFNWKKQNIKKDRKKKITITLGCDPEFELYKGEQLIRPSTIGISSLDGKIGSDGAGDQLELRPSPEQKVDKLVNNIRELIKKVVLDYKVSLKDSGDNYPLGGHIHIGGITPTGDVIKLLDDLIGKLTINLSGYARGSYKRLGAIEIKPWGFEYRTPPAAIFHCPKVLKIILKLIKNALTQLTRKGSLELNDTIGKDDYLKFITEKDYNCLIDFINNYWAKYSKETLEAAWRIKQCKIEHTIMFRDDWNEQIINKVRKYLLRGYKLTQDIGIFGLKQERGLVTTLQDEQLNKIYPHCERFVSNITNFGLPWKFRMEKLNYKALRRIKQLLIENGILVKRRAK